nr:hypothetical protein [Tanacetum cinerariifolium]
MITTTYHKLKIEVKDYELKTKVKAWYARGRQAVGAKSLATGRIIGAVSTAAFVSKYSMLKNYWGICLLYNTYFMNRITTWTKAIAYYDKCDLFQGEEVTNSAQISVNRRLHVFQLRCNKYFAERMISEVTLRRNFVMQKRYAN